MSKSILFFAYKLFRRKTKIILFIILLIGLVFIYIGAKTQKQVRNQSNVYLSRPVSQQFIERIAHKNVKNRSLISLSNIDGVFLDLNKAAVFYTQDDVLTLTFLFQTRQIWSKAYQVNLRVRRDEKTIWNGPIDIINYHQVMKTRDYTFTVFQTSFGDDLCSWPCPNNTINNSTKLTYQLNVNGRQTPEFDINVVNISLNSESKLTARLIKCMWMPNDVKTFKYIMNLIIDSKYDSIYICLFAQDHELKSLLKEFESRQKINIIELENVPHVDPGKEDLKSREQILNDTTIEDKGFFMDTVLEFLLNQVYPFLVEKYHYVQAADFDHILFTRNQTFYERVNEILKKKNMTSGSSLYLNQHWGIGNKVAFAISNAVKIYLHKKWESNVVLRNGSKLEANSSGIWNQSLLEPEVYIPIEGFNFEIKITGLADWNHAISLLNCLNNHTRNFSNDVMFRHLILKFSMRYVYGQTIHDTYSSKIIKLCEPADFFSGGGQVSLESPHFIHYRDEYNFDVIKNDGRSISIRNFVCWSDYDAQEV